MTNHIDFYLQIKANAETLVGLHVQMDEIREAFKSLNRTRKETKAHIEKLTANLEEMMGSAPRDFRPAVVNLPRVSLEPIEVDPAEMRTLYGPMHDPIKISHWDSESYVSTQEAADLLDMGPDYIRGLYRRGEIQVYVREYRKTAAYYYRTEDIEQAIRKRTGEAS